MKNLVRKDILKVMPYKAGKPIEETKRELGLKSVIKLASNENPLGPSPRAVAAMEKILRETNRYPDSQSFYLKKKLAQMLKVGPQNIVTGNGSDELIDVIIKTLVEKDENIVTADTTFLEYEIISRVNGREVLRVPLKNFAFDLENIRKKINRKTKLVFIANPNNPTGTYVNETQVASFISSLPERVVVVFDEAYDTFIDTNDFPEVLSYVKRGNVIVMKTFSKAYGLAGLRVGYLVADPDLVSYMERVRQPFNVNMIAQAGALAALGDTDFLAKTKDCVLQGKAYLYRQLDTLGIRYIPSVTNFILIDVGKNGLDVFKNMLKCGVIVRDMQQYGLTNFIRVTIGTAAENKRFIEVFKKVLL